MRLVTIDCGRNGEPGVLLASGEVLHLRQAALAGTVQVWLPDSVRDILEAGEEGLAVLRLIVERVQNSTAAELATLRDRGVVTPATTRLLAPVPDPRLIVAAGLAYRSHLAEMAGTPVPPHPTAFMKSVNSLTGTCASIPIPKDAAEHLDYEGELAVIFGRKCHGVSSDEALDYVAGYTVANDVSARDWVADVWDATSPWDARRTWEVNIMGKQFPGFTPLGPTLLTIDEVPDVNTLRLTTRLNGVVMQSEPVADLIFSIAEMIAYFSKWYEFRPGDVLLTGTPAGVGVGRKPPVFMKDGDVIEVEVAGIGVLRNVIEVQ
ncbi:fumarylacetoacetate hydrolase family protein [Pusillimonas sp.]|uniref:fumarylacetoacetate hydrolase family protein n=1 Tax=Pusillimonas sp. TaxID=3040095 RepID=UPI0037C88D58